MSAYGRPPGPVVVCGESLVDQLPDGKEVPGGAPFNVACWLAGLGVPTTLVTRVGLGDARAAKLMLQARRCGVLRRGIQLDSEQPTGVAQVHLEQGRPLYRVAEVAAWDHMDASAAVAATREATPLMVIFGTLGQRSPKSRAAIRAVLGVTRALRLADLNLREQPGLMAITEETLRMADWVKATDTEMTQLLRWFVCGGAEPPKDQVRLGRARRALMERFGTQRIIVTCGALGWHTLNADGEMDDCGVSWPVPRPVDKVGAGDAFTAAIAAGYAAHWPLGPSLRAAARLAAWVCGRSGGLPADEAAIDQWRDDFGIAARPRQHYGGLIG